jgi:hypothetical protein
MCGPFGWSLTVRVFFLKNPPRSLCCHDLVQLIRKYAAPAENQAVLVKLDYPLFCLISDPKHLRQCTPLSERRHPERGNQVARLRLRSLLESLRYKWTSHLSPEPRLVRVCTQTVPVVTIHNSLIEQGFIGYNDLAKFHHLKSFTIKNKTGFISSTCISGFTDIKLCNCLRASLY